ncbi:nicotinamidase/pyrazinamidase [Sphingomonas insulae]|uniref:nicotinamidase n=1 Tax=Sphingomonas insulae TaxID=424800 RepID=A0ABN1HYV3_9SPHN|nr:bifunctional nicotinamidase/pyrazinamidase [Sphingomonas insulae]NIJ28770.1 nicotinamidase/pyrazinamidase [Sphingomonas insulae]
MPFSPHRNDALIVIDPQNDFCANGALAVADADAIMPAIADLAATFAHVIVTQDWHPAGHSSFASSHPGATPFTTVVMPYGEQVLWPDHCVQGSHGAAFHPAVAAAVTSAGLILRKGHNPTIDSYSAFRENDRVTPTGLAGYLRDIGVTRCVLVGLAYDFCVGWSALDAVEHGFEAVVLRDLTRAIAMPLADGRTTVDETEVRFAAAGVVLA